MTFEEKLDIILEFLAERYSNLSVADKFNIIGDDNSIFSDILNIDLSKLELHQIESQLKSDGYIEPNATFPHIFKISAKGIAFTNTGYVKQKIEKDKKTRQIVISIVITACGLLVSIIALFLIGK